MSRWCLVWMERQKGGAELGLRLWIDEDDLQGMLRFAGELRSLQLSYYTLEKNPNPDQKMI